MFSFFKKIAFGLNISDYSIEIIFLEKSLEKSRFLALGRQVLKPGIIEDGKILQKGKLEISLRNLIESLQFRQIKTKNFVFSFPESKSFICTFKATDTSERKIVEREANLQAAQNFPFPPKDLFLDFKIKNQNVILAAAQKDIVEDYLEIFKKLKLQPVALEAESLSLARALIGKEKETVLIADIGARTTNFSIFDEESLELSITIDIAGNQFTEVLATKLNVSKSEAENLKKKIGLDPEKKEGKVFLVLQKEMQKIISEINKIDDYFQKKEGKSFEKIILAGGSVSLSHLAEYLTENLEKPVSIGDPWKKIDITILKEKEYLKEVAKVNPVLYAAAIGSALRGLAKNPKTVDINLLPKS